MMGTDYVQFDILVNIPEIHVVLKRHDNARLIELVIEQMKSHT